VGTGRKKKKGWASLRKKSKMEPMERKKKEGKIGEKDRIKEGGAVQV